jgi:uncharacterized protein
MKTVFADAGYWVALVNPGDDLHHRAKSISAALAPIKIVTSEMVLTELLNSFSKKGEGLRKTTVALIRDINADPAIDIIPQTSELFSNAFELYEQRPDQAWSHTDCASFHIMQQQNILEAFTTSGITTCPYKRGKQQPSLRFAAPSCPTWRLSCGQHHLAGQFQFAFSFYPCKLAYHANPTIIDLASSWSSGYQAGAW